jgi:oligoribonuclease
MKFAILDLETTGLTVNPGRILEVSVTIMDTDFATHEEYTSAVHNHPTNVEPLLNDWTQRTHGESGLLKECYDQSTPSLFDIETSVTNLLCKHFLYEKVVLVGNSIHFDRKWIDAYMPMLSEKLHYRMLDVSALWEYMRIFHDIKRPDNGPIVHRGLPDTRGSAKLLKQFGEYIKERS